MSWKDYTSLSREALLEKIQQKVNPHRFNHILGVERVAIRLAKQYGVNQTKASIAALVHDYGKEVDDEVYQNLMIQHHREDLASYGNNIWHGKLGVYLIERDLHIHDRDILHAVSVHTTGAVHMNMLDKILFVADYIEPSRQFPGVEEARTLAYQSLDEAVRYELQHTLLFLIEQNKVVFPETIQAYNVWNAHLMMEEKENYNDQ